MEKSSGIGSVELNDPGFRPGLVWREAHPLRSPKGSSSAQDGGKNGNTRPTVEIELFMASSTSSTNLKACALANTLRRPIYVTSPPSEYMATASP